MYALSGYLAGQAFASCSAATRRQPFGAAARRRTSPALLLPFAAAAVVHVLANHA